MEKTPIKGGIPKPGTEKSISNTNGYGDGAKNNTIGWGQAACSPNYGESQKDSWSPSTDLFPCSGPPPVGTKRSYNNLFDNGLGITPILSGLNDTDFLSGVTTFTSSFWLDVIPDFANWTQPVVPLSKVVAGRGGIDFFIDFTRVFSGALEVRIWINETNVFTNRLLTQNMNQWNHIFFRYDSTKSMPLINELYINNVLITNESTTQIVSFQAVPKVFSIGTKTDTGISEEMDITKIGLWNRTLTLAEKTSIYNNGCPTDLGPYSPNLYLKIDDYTTNLGQLQFPDSGSASGTWESQSDETDGISTSVPCP